MANSINTTGKIVPHLAKERTLPRVIKSDPNKGPRKPVSTSKPDTVKKKR